MDVVTATRCTRTDEVTKETTDSTVRGELIIETTTTVNFVGVYTYTCVFDGKGSTTSASGAVTVTLPPKAPVVTMAMADSNNITVTVDILNHIRSKQLSTDYQLTCNDTNTARTVDIVLTGPATVTLAALQPSTTYSCWAKATSSAGDSQNSNTASATTDDSPKPTVSTTDVNATAVWVKVTLPALIPNVAVSGVRIWRATDENDASSWSAWEVVATVSSADADGAYRYVDGARASQTRYRYKAVFLTPAYSKESDPQNARTGPPAPELTLNYAKAYEVKLNVTQSGLKTSFVAQTLIWRNDTRICTTGPDALDSCLDNSAADVSPGITYKYVAQYRGIAFYGGAPDNQKFGEFSAPLYVTTPLVVKPSITHEKITATTAEVCVTYPADDSRFEIKTTEFSRLYLPEAEVNTFSITRTAAAKDCKTLTGLEPATTSNITAHYTTTGVNSTTSDVLQVTQASPAAPSLSVNFDPAYPNATAVKVRVKYPTQPADSSMQTNPEEDLLPVVTRIDLYRNGSLVGSQTAVSTTDTYVFIDGRLAPGLLYFYEATLFTEFTNSPNKSALAETDIAAKPTITATGIDRNTSAITLVVDHPVPEQAAAVTIRIYRSEEQTGTYLEIAEIQSKPEPQDVYTYTDTSRAAGTRYWYKAEYTTFGEPDGIAGKVSELSVADGAWTAPAPPAFSLSSAEVTDSGVVNVILQVAPSLTGNSVTGLVISRDDTGAIICSMLDSPQWVNGVVGTAACEDDDAEPAVTYTYTAHYVGEEELTSKRAHFNVTTPPEAPAVVKGPYLATTSSISVEIELPAGWEKSNGTELYRDGKLIVTLPTPGQCSPCQSASAECCLVYEDKAGLSPGHAYNYTALLTVDNGGVRVTSPESPKTELWTALPAPRPVIGGTTAVPSVTVNVSLPANLEDVVVATKCWENAATTPSLASLTNEPFMALFCVSNEQFVVTSTSNLASMPSVDWATTYVWVCVYLGKGESRSEPGNVTVTLPPKAPVVAMTMVDSNTINVTVDIQNHAASKQLSTDYQLTCNDTNTARTVDIVLTGPATVTLAALQPSTTYSCWAKATSSAGDSQNSNTASATTDDSPKPTVSTTDVNATAVWVKVTLPALIPNVAVSGVRIWRATDENDAPSWSAWEVAATVSSADADGAYRYVDGARASQTRYRYKAVFLTPAYSKESDPQNARTGPPAPELTLNYAKAYEVKLNVTQSGLKTSFVAQTLIWRNDTRICTTGPDALDSCLDNSAADVSPGIAYKYVAQYIGVAFYGGAPDDQKFGEFSAPLYVTTPLVVKPSITHEKITATTAEVCVTYPADDSRFEIKTTEFSRLYLPEAEVNTFSITRTAAAKDCKTLTGLEPATTSNITAHYTTTGVNSTTSDVLQVTQASPAAPSLSVNFDPAYPNATAVKVRVKYPTQPADSSMQTNPEEDLLPVIKRIDLFRNGSLVGSQTAVGTTDTYVFIDGGLAPGLLYFYEATLFTEFTNSPNKSALAETDIAAKPTITATGIDRNTSAITLVVDHPVPEQAAAVTIRIYRSEEQTGTYLEIAEIQSKPEPQDVYTYTDTSRAAGTRYWYKAEYTTFGEPDGIAGKVSELSVADGAWTAPAPPAFSLSSAEVTDSGVVNVILQVAPSLTGNSVTGLVISRDDTGAIICSMLDSPQWVNGVVGTAACEDDDAEPAVTYTYTAYYVGEEELTSKRAHFNVTTPPEAPAVVKGPYLATTSSISVEIELPAGWEKSNGTELYRDGKLIVTLPTPGQCSPCQSASAECCLVYEDKAGLSPGHAYNYTALLTVDNGGVRVTSPESPKTELWTALPAPRPVIGGTTAVPSVTVNVSLPANLEDVVVATKCWENAATTPSLASLTNEPFMALFCVSNEQFVVTSTSNLASMPSVDWATTYVWVCVYLGKGESRSEPGNVTVTLPPKAPVVAMTMVDSNTINVTVDIQNHAASKQLSTDYQLTCNDTNTARTVDIVLTGPAMVTLAALQPSTTYSCWAKATSSAGDSQNSNTASATTDDSPKPTVSTTDVNATAVWVKVTLPALIPNVAVSGVRIWRATDENDASSWSAWEVVATVSSADADGAYRYVDGGRASQTRYRYKAVFLTPAYSKESDPQNARTGPPAPELTLNYAKAYEVKLNVTQSGLKTSFVAQTLIWRNDTRICTTGPDALDSCLDNSAADVSPGITYKYVAQYRGVAFYGGAPDDQKFGEFSAPLYVTTPLVVKPSITHEKITATTAEVCVTYPADDSRFEIKTTEFSRLYLPEAEVNTFSITRTAAAKDCKTLTGLEPATTSNITAHYTTTGVNSTTSDVLQVTQAIPASPVLALDSVNSSPSFPTATVVKVKVTYPTRAPEANTIPGEDLRPVVTRIDLYRDGMLAASQTMAAPRTVDFFVFTDSGLPPGLTFAYEAALFTLYSKSPNGSLSAKTKDPAAPTLAAKGIDATSVKVTVAKPVPEQDAAVAIRIYTAASEEGPYSKLTEILKTSTTYEYTHSGLAAGSEYWYKADYTTAGKPSQTSGVDSPNSTADSAWTSPNPPVLSLTSSTTASSGDASTSILHVEPSTPDDDITVLVLERFRGGFLCKVNSSWAGDTPGVTDCTDDDASPATPYTYVAYYIGKDGMESTRVNITITTPPGSPTVVQGPYPATTTTTSVQIELPQRWVESNGTELYRDGQLIATLPNTCTPCSAPTGCCLLFNDTGLVTGRAYNYTALLTVDNDGVVVKSPLSDPKELWTALPAPQPVVVSTTTGPSVTVSVPLPAGLEGVVTSTVCWEDTTPGTTFTVSNGQFTFTSSSAPYTVDFALSYVWVCEFKGKGGTTSQTGQVDPTLPPAAPNLEMTPLNSTTIMVTVTIDNDASKALTNSTILVCNGTAGTQTIAPSPSGVTVVYLTVLPGEVISCNAVLDSPAGKSDKSDSDSSNGQEGDPVVVQTQYPPKPTVTWKRDPTTNQSVCVNVYVPATEGITIGNVYLYLVQSDGTLSASAVFSGAWGSGDTQKCPGGLNSFTNYNYTARYDTQGAPSVLADLTRTWTRPSPPIGTNGTRGAQWLQFVFTDMDASGNGAALRVLKEQSDTDAALLATYQWEYPDVDVRTHNQTSLQPGDTRTYFARIVQQLPDGLGDLRSDFSNPVTMTTLVPGAPFLRNTSMDLDRVSIQVTLAQDGTESAVTEVLLQRDFGVKELSCVKDEPASIPQTYTCPTDTGLNASQTYTYRAKAITLGEDSEWSSNLVVTLGRPNPPALFFTEPAMTTLATLTSVTLMISPPYTPPGVITGFVVYLVTDAGPVEVHRNSSVSLTFTHADRLPGTAYNYTAKVLTLLSESDMSPLTLAWTKTAPKPTCTYVNSTSTTVKLALQIPAVATTLADKLRLFRSDLLLDGAISKDGAIAPSSLERIVTGLNASSSYVFSVDYTTTGALSFRSDPCEADTSPPKPIITPVLVTPIGISVHISLQSGVVDNRITHTRLMRDGVLVTTLQGLPPVVDANRFSDAGVAYRYTAIFVVAPNDVVTAVGDESAPVEIVVPVATPVVLKVREPTTTAIEIKVWYSEQDVALGYNAQTITGATIYRDNVVVRQADATSALQAWTDTAVRPSTWYAYTAKFNTSGNPSNVSAELSLRTPDLPFPPSGTSNAAVLSPSWTKIKLDAAAAIAAGAPNVAGVYVTDSSGNWVANLTSGSPTIVLSSYAGNSIQPDVASYSFTFAYVMAYDDGYVSTSTVTYTVSTWPRPTCSVTASSITPVKMTLTANTKSKGTGWELYIKSGASFTGVSTKPDSTGLFPEETYEYHVTVTGGPDQETTSPASNSCFGTTTRLNAPGINATAGTGSYENQDDITVTTTYPTDTGLKAVIASTLVFRDNCNTTVCAESAFNTSSYSSCVSSRGCTTTQVKNIAKSSAAEESFVDTNVPRPSSYNYKAFFVSTNSKDSFMSSASRVDVLATPTPSPSPSPSPTPSPSKIPIPDYDDDKNDQPDGSGDICDILYNIVRSVVQSSCTTEMAALSGKSGVTWLTPNIQINLTFTTPAKLQQQGLQRTGNLTCSIDPSYNFTANGINQDAPLCQAEYKITDCSGAGSAGGQPISDIGFFNTSGAEVTFGKMNMTCSGMPGPLGMVYDGIEPQPIVSFNSTLSDWGSKTIAVTIKPSWIPSWSKIMNTYVERWRCSDPSKTTEYTFFSFEGNQTSLIDTVPDNVGVYYCYQSWYFVNITDRFTGYDWLDIGALNSSFFYRNASKSAENRYRLAPYTCSMKLESVWMNTTYRRLKFALSYEPATSLRNIKGIIIKRMRCPFDSAKDGILPKVTPCTEGEASIEGCGVGRCFSPIRKTCFNNATRSCGSWTSPSQSAADFTLYRGGKVDGLRTDPLPSVYEVEGYDDELPSLDVIHWRSACLLYTDRTDTASSLTDEPQDARYDADDTGCRLGGTDDPYGPCGPDPRTTTVTPLRTYSLIRKLTNIKRHELRVLLPNSYKSLGRDGAILGVQVYRTDCKTYNCRFVSDGRVGFSCDNNNLNCATWHSMRLDTLFTSPNYSSVVHGNRIAGLWDVGGNSGGALLADDGGTGFFKIRVQCPNPSSSSPCDARSLPTCYCLNGWPKMGGLKSAGATPISASATKRRAILGAIKPSLPAAVEPQGALSTAQLPSAVQPQLSLPRRRMLSASSVSVKRVLWPGAQLPTAVMVNGGTIVYTSSSSDGQFMLRSITYQITGIDRTEVAEKQPVPLVCWQQDKNVVIDPESLATSYQLSDGYSTSSSFFRLESTGRRMHAGNAYTRGMTLTIKCPAGSKCPSPVCTAPTISVCARYDSSAKGFSSAGCSSTYECTGPSCQTIPGSDGPVGIIDEAYVSGRQSFATGTMNWNDLGWSVTSCTCDSIDVVTLIQSVPPAIPKAALPAPNPVPAVPPATGGADTARSSSSSNIGVIVGGVIGGVALVAIAVVAVYAARIHYSRKSAIKSVTNRGDQVYAIGSDRASHELVHVSEGMPVSHPTSVRVSNEIRLATPALSAQPSFAAPATPAPAVVATAEAVSEGDVMLAMPADAEADQLSNVSERSERSSVAPAGVEQVPIITL
eukprot:tig00000431_g677.t1